MPAIELDLRELPAPEPLQKVLAALDGMSAGDFLHALHRRDPQCLFPILEEMGLAHLQHTQAPGLVHIWIWPAQDRQAQMAAQTAAQMAARPGAQH